MKKYQTDPFFKGIVEYDTGSNKYTNTTQLQVNNNNNHKKNVPMNIHTIPPETKAHNNNTVIITQNISLILILISRPSPTLLTNNTY